MLDIILPYTPVKYQEGMESRYLPSRADAERNGRRQHIYVFLNGRGPTVPSAVCVCVCSFRQTLSVIACKLKLCRQNHIKLSCHAANNWICKMPHVRPTVVNSLTWTYGETRKYLPHAGLLAVHYGHVVDFVLLDASLLRLVQLLRDEAHEGVVRRVSWTWVCVCSSVRQW